MVKWQKKGRNQHSLGGVFAVADPDLQVRGRESHKNFFSALRASVWSKNKGGPPQDPPLLHKGRVDCTCPGRIRGYPRTSRSPNNFLQNFTTLPFLCITLKLAALITLSRFLRGVCGFSLDIEPWIRKNLKKPYNIGGFHAISGDTNNKGEMNKCWWTNKAS